MSKSSSASEWLHSVSCRLDGCPGHLCEVDLDERSGMVFVQAQEGASCVIWPQPAWEAAIRAWFEIERPVCPVEGAPIEGATILLPADLREWAKAQPEGLSRLLQCLLAEERSRREENARRGYPSRLTEFRHECPQCGEPAKERGQLCADRGACSARLRPDADEEGP